MPGSVITSLRKEICFTFHLKLSDRPLACRVANAVLLGELVPGGTALVFGAYDLVLCHAVRGRRGGESFYTEVFPRTFAVQIPLNAAVKQGDVLVSLSRSFEAVFRPGRPSGVRFWELLKSLIWEGTWMEIVVEGEITVEVLPAGEPRLERGSSVDSDAGWEQDDARDESQERKGSGDGSREILKEEGRKKTARKKGEEITIELDALADLVPEPLRRRSEQLSVDEKGATQPADLPGLDAVTVTQGKQPQQEGDQAQQKAEIPGCISGEMLEELIRKVIREYDEERRGRAADAASITSLPLEQIPSRPGLYRSFTQNLPPPKPAGSGS